MSEEYCELEGVSTHNLKGIDVRFPLYRFSVVTGVSGSGKSSLVFDTLYGEAYRRYLESLSSFARQYLQALPKPPIRAVRHLPPAIAVRQTRKGANKRSTVGTLTEVQDLLQVLFTHLAEVHCSGCGARVQKHESQSVLRWIKEQHFSSRLLLTAPLMAWSKLKPQDVRQLLLAQGFSRIYWNEEIHPLEELELSGMPKAKGQDNHAFFQAEVVIDRLQPYKPSELAEKNAEDDDSEEGRRRDSLNLAFSVGRGTLYLRSEAQKGEFKAFCQSLRCLPCNRDFLEASPSLFSFTHPLGACATCQGYGQEALLAWDKVFPDQTLSLASEGIAALNFGQHSGYYREIAKAAKKRGLNPKKIFSTYSDAEWQWLKYGDDADFGGMAGYFTWLDSQKYKPHYRMHRAKYLRYHTCSQCLGARLQAGALAYKLANEHFASVTELSAGQLTAWLERVQNLAVKTDQLAKQDAVKEALAEMHSRLRYLDKIGLSYLSLARGSTTLSGGELQRIHMARCLGSALTDSLFCLDEPTAGLHPKDSQALLELIRELRDLGNTVVAVEHDQSIIAGADHCIEIGPGAGHLGGELSFSGSPAAYQLALAAKAPPAPAQPQSATKQSFLSLKGVSTHNLQEVSVQIPLGCFTAVCGVSGSGKSSLIQHSLYPLLEAYFEHGQDQPGVALSCGELALNAKNAGRELLHAVHLVDQTPLARSSRSNLVTYLGIFDQIRKLLASTAEAKKAGLLPGAFSFNVPGGRCDTCAGMGTVVEDLSFLGEMDVLCADCQGQRFKESVLQIRYKGKNLVSILALTVMQAQDFFSEHTKIVEVLQEVIDMGLSYITLGQATSDFSGGEAQRLKLLQMVGQAREEKPCCLIFDEPTLGLSDRDVTTLIAYLRRLVKRSHSVIVVEHHVGLLRAADYLIELGPGAAEKGGRVLFQGRPKEILACKESVTKNYLF